MTKLKIFILMFVMVMVWGVTPTHAAGTQEFLQVVSSGTNTTSYSFATQNLGTEAADRCLVWMISGRGSATTTIAVENPTIAGIAADILIQQANGDANTGFVAWVSATVPTGTTGTLAFELSNTALRVGTGLFRLTGVDCNSPFDTASSIVAGAPSGTIDIPANGVALGGCQAGGSGTVAWTNLTEAFDTTQAEGFTYSGAADDFVDETLGHTVTCNPGAGFDSGIFLSFSPFAAPAEPVELVQCAIANSTSTSIPVSLTGVSTGNLLFVGAAFSDNTALVTGISDGEGNTYENIEGPDRYANIGHDPSVELWMAKNVTGTLAALTATVVVGSGTAGGTHYVWMCEISGADADDPVDASEVGNPLTTTGSALSINMDVAEDDSLGVAMFMSATDPTAGSGWNIQNGYIGSLWHLQTKPLDAGSGQLVNATYASDPGVGMISAVIFRPDDGEGGGEIEIIRPTIIGGGFLIR